MDKEKLQRGLGLFLDAMRPYVVSVVERECRDGVSWDMDFEHRMDNYRCDKVGARGKILSLS